MINFSYSTHLLTLKKYHKNQSIKVLSSFPFLTASNEMNHNINWVKDMKKESIMNQNVYQINNRKSKWKEQIQLNASTLVCIGNDKTSSIDVLSGWKINFGY